MLKIGCHLSSAKGFEAMGKSAVSIQANTFQFFTRNPRGSRAKAIKEEDVERFLACIISIPAATWGRAWRRASVTLPGCSMGF